jgi:hypothetical protein
MVIVDPVRLLLELMTPLDPFYIYIAYNTLDNIAFLETYLILHY